MLMGDSSNKAVALKSWVKTILYSSDVIEIELFLKTALPTSWDAKGNEITASACPKNAVENNPFRSFRERANARSKMPPPIFGRAETMIGVRGATYINKIKETKRKRYYYYRCTCTLKRDWNTCPIRQVSATRLDDFIVQNLDRVSKDRQYLESLSFMLSKELPGVGKGFELSGQEPALTSKNIKLKFHQIFYE